MSRRPDLGFFDDGQDLTAPAFYADATRPFGDAQVLPPAAFRSLHFYFLEDEAIWSRGWICSGAHGDIPTTGDLLPFTAGHHGLHVQRLADGSIIARFNKAQHGGCRVVPLQCRGGKKTACSFTSCGYSRDRAAIPAGDLGDGTPEMHQYLGLRPERLFRAEVASWGPLIFVNVDPAPAPFEDAAGSLPSATFFNNAKGRRIAGCWMEVDADWKVLGQHLAAGHVTETAQNWMMAEGELSNGEPLSTAWLFPSLILLATEVETFAVALQPTAIGRTLCRISLFGPNDADASRLEFWMAEIGRRAQAAEDELGRLAKWGTASRPDTIGRPLPLQTDRIGHWLQQGVAEKVLTRSTPFIEEPLYSNPKM